MTVHWGIPVTTPLRTLLDLFQTLSLDALDAALAEALVRKLVRLEDVQARATGGLAKLVGTAAPTRSRLERDCRALLREHGLPQPLSNGRVEGYEVDLHWPELKLVVEVDGYAVHGHRRAFETDRVRDQELLAAGWRVAPRHRPSDDGAAGRDRGALQPAAARASASLERHDLDHGADRQGPVEVRERLPRRRRELDAQVVERGLVDHEHDQVGHARVVARRRRGQLRPAREVDDPPMSSDSALYVPAVRAASQAERDTMWRMCAAVTPARAPARP